jgi:hypothetical protein
MPATVLGDQYVTIGVGSTALRPTSPTQGMLRYNTDLSLTEINADGTTTGWAPVAVSAYNILTIDGSGNLIHNQVLGSDTSTSITQIENANATFFSNKMSIALDSLGNMTATY